MKLSLPFFFYYISATVQSFAFAPNHYHYHSTSSNSNSNSNSNRGAIIILHSQNPFAGYNPGSAASDPTPTSSQQKQEESPNEDGDGDDDEASLKGNRWSKFAPDASLSSEDFRSQLKENMKADLERRRREDPNRGNQPAKSYLDNL